MKIDSLVKSSQTRLNTDTLTRFTPEDRLFRDSIQLGKSEVNHFWETVKDLFFSIWIFFKNHFLFCFFDLEKEEKSNLESEYKVFQDFYFANSHDLDNKSKEKFVAQKYRKLSKELKKIIEEEIKTFIWKQLPETKKAQNMREIVNNVLKNPFSTLQISKEPSDSDPRIFEAALFNTGLRLHEIGNENDEEGD